MPQNLVISGMTAENVEDVAAIERECFASPWSLDSLKSELANPLAVFRVSSLGGKIAGYAGMHNVAGEGYITNVAVLPEYRKNGIAKALMEDIIQYGRQNGLAFITLEVRESNAAARALYTGLGFERAGLRKGFYTLPAEDGVIMTLYM